MRIDRRAFLRALAASAVGMTLDPERLLWVPKPMIVVPAMPALYTGGPATLLEWARRMDPDGKIARIVELINQSNGILDDLRWIEAPTQIDRRTVQSSP